MLNASAERPAALASHHIESMQAGASSGGPGAQDPGSLLRPGIAIAYVKSRFATMT